ncbi:MAG: hypothetical protein HY293_22825 [Planctomycetes bacterium]|nr:hypothetical protein [Planctomycetota bacterium]
MRTLPALILAPLLFFQSDPLAAAKKDLGPGFAVERVEPGILLATEERGGGGLLESVRKAVKGFRARALDVPPQNSLLIIVFAGAESYKAYTARRYPGGIPQTIYYDVLSRRVLLRSEAGRAYALQVSRIFLLADSLNDGAIPPWIAAALSALDEPDPEPATFDHRAALLREALRRGTFPALRTFFALDLGAFHGRDVLSLHTSTALKFAEWLEKRGALKKFFEEYRKSYRKDITGAAAVEAALGGKLEAVEKDFAAHLKGLPWLNQERFLEQAKKVFGENPLIQVDEELMLAVTGNVEPRVAKQALDQVRLLREPLVKMLDLKTSGLPVLARLFKDQAAFQEYAKIDSPNRQWVGGYFSFDSRWLVLHLEPDSGSLVHEYCHSLFEDDLGRLPPWFSEGIAQLFERFRLENGLPVGERGSTLRDVRAGLLQNRVANLQDFVNFRGPQFFGADNVSLNYDVAHALMLYIQEKRAIAAMVKEVKKAKAANPFALPVATCRAALETALGAKVEKINDDFRTWVTSTKD